VRYAGSPQFDATPAIQAEHICLQSDEFVVNAPIRGKRIGPALKIASRFRNCETELALLEGHRLEVRSWRPHRARLKYVVELRFFDSAPITRLSIDWRSWVAGLLLAALAAASYRLATATDSPSWMQLGLPGSIALLVAAVCVVLLALYRTNETVQFRSVHGRAVLVEFTGNVGCARAAGAFTAELRRQIADARAQAAQSKQQFLRDELREHRRLFDDGVLSEDAYEAGKLRILQAHG
jgi:hypothetical protein